MSGYCVTGMETNPRIPKITTMMEITVERTYRHVSGNPFFSLHIGFEITFRTPSGAIVREKTRNCYAKKEEAFVMNAFREKKLRVCYFSDGGKDSVLLPDF